MNYKQQEKAIAIIKASLPYVKQAHNEAECKHDSEEYYMDSEQREIM